MVAVFFSRFVRTVQSGPMCEPFVEIVRNNVHWMLPQGPQDDGSAKTEKKMRKLSFNIATKSYGENVIDCLEIEKIC